MRLNPFLWPIRFVGVFKENVVIAIFIFDYLQKAGKEVGKLCLEEAKIKKTYTFLDYIMGGTKLNCSVAIDFTGLHKRTKIQTS